MTPRQRRPVFAPGVTLLDPIVDSGDWRDQARCAEVDPEIFFPEKGGSTRPAKKICAGCEVRTPCLEDALTQDDRFGIYGGLSDRERRKLKRQRDSAQNAPQPQERAPQRAPKSPKRRVTVSDLEVVRARREAGDPLTVIAEDYDVTHSYLSKLLAGHSTPAPDPVAENAPAGPDEAGKVAA